MYLESLIRLTMAYDEYEKSGKHLVSEKFHKETKALILQQTNFLVTELEFLKDNHRMKY